MKHAQFTAPAARCRSAFTLLEVMVAMTVLAILMALTTSLVDQTQETLSRTKGRADQFRQARRAFETVTRRLAQATLNTYWDYEYDRAGKPQQYVRQSELHFVSGQARDLVGAQAAPGHAVFFQAPFGYAGGEATGASTAADPYRGMETLLNAWGFYVEWGEDQDVPPFILSRPWFKNPRRFRLMEYRQPSEELRIYADNLRDKATNRDVAYQWFRTGITDHRNVRAVAENIVALIIRPSLSAEVARRQGIDPWMIAPQYLYDSREFQWGGANPRKLLTRNQVPPLLEVTMIAIDDASARRLGSGGSAPNLGLDALFRNAADFDDDLKTFEEGQRKGDGRDRLNYKIFSATVALRTAKWSD